MRYDNVALLSTSANVYFNGKVVSFSFKTADGLRNTVGVMFPGTYKFKTDCPEKIRIFGGSVHVSIVGVPSKVYAVGDQFEVPAKTEFLMICESRVDYVCTYLAGPTFIE